MLLRWQTEVSSSPGQSVATPDAATLARSDVSPVLGGGLRVRVAGRGVRLADHPRQPDLEYWLTDELGLDDYAGDYARARITVELLEDDAGDTERPKLAAS